MNGRVAKKLRRENPEQPRQYSRPFLAMLPEGEIGGDGKRQLIPVHIPRATRRLILRKMNTDIRKGRLNGRPE